MSATMLFNNLITFSRGTSATLTGPTGLIQWAPMNLLTYSEQFDNAAWPKAAVTVTANVATAPDGTATADLLVESATNANHLLNRSGVVSPATGSYTLSVYAKAATRNWMRVQAQSPSNAWVNVNLSTGATGLVGGDLTNVSVISVGDGWYRISGTTTVVSQAIGAQLFVLDSDRGGASPSYLGDGTSGIYVWGAQLELGTTATTYNSTTTKNLLGYSEAFDNAAWAKARTSVVTGAAANPINGLFNAQKLMEDTTASNSHFASQTVSGHISGTTYTFSIYAKAAGRTQLRMNGDTAFGLANPAIFNLDTGTVASNGAFTASIQSIGNGWYRCVCTGTPTAAGSGVWVVGLAVSGTTSYTGDGNSGVYIWGAQLSDSGSLDPYVPTPGAAPTSAAYYGPRFDYDPVTLAAKGLLIEEARTNLLLRTTLAGGGDPPTGWTKPIGTGTGTATVSIFGANDGAVAYTQTATAQRPFYQQTVTTVASTVYTISMRIEAVSGLTYSDIIGVSGVAQSAYRLNGATVSGAATAQTGFIECVFTASGTPMDIRIGIGLNGSATGSVTFSRPQLEAGAFATSYIPTVASTVTRSADVATLTGSNFAPWYNQTAGTVVWSGDFAVIGSNRLVSIDAGASARTADIYPVAPNAVVYYKTSDATQTQIGTGVSVNTVCRVAVAIKADDYIGALNGTTGGADTATGGVAVADRMSIGHWNSGGFLNGHIRSVTYYPDRLSNTQLQSLTT